MMHNIRENNAMEHQASVKNRRLAQQMEWWPAVMTALKLKKVSRNIKYDDQEPEA